MSEVYLHSVSATLQVSTVPFAFDSETCTVIQEQTLHFSDGGSFFSHLPAQTVGRGTHCGFVRLEITVSVVLIIADGSGQIQAPDTEAGEAWDRTYFQGRRNWNANLRLSFSDVLKHDEPQYYCHNEFLPVTYTVIESF